MKMSFEEAKRLSILKWEAIVEKGYFITMSNIDEEYPELKELINNCGFCERYLSSHILNCDLCELNMEFDNGCRNINHPFMKVRTYPNDPYAIELLEFIKNVEQNKSN